MRRLSPLNVVSLVVVLAAAATGTARAQSEWREFVYPAQQFAVSFPASPTIATIRSDQSDATGVTKTVYAVDQGGARFELAVFDLLLTHLDEPTVIARAAASLRRNGEVAVDIASEVQGHWGRFVSVRKSDGSHMIAAVYYRNERLYEIEATAPDSNLAAVSSGMVRFQQSLRFTGPLKSRRFAPPPAEGALQNVGGRFFGPDGAR